MKTGGSNVSWMKGFPALVLLLAGCSPSTPTAATVGNTIEGCKAVSEMAEAVMRNRQSGGDMAAAMQASSSPASQRIVQAAYAEPHYMTPEMQTRVIQDFKNEAFADCLKE